MQVGQDMILLDGLMRLSQWKKLMIDLQVANEKLIDLVYTVFHLDKFY